MRRGRRRRPRGRSGGSELCRAWRRRSARSARRWSQAGAPRIPTRRAGTRSSTRSCRDLREYSPGAEPTARLTPLNRLYQMSPALATVPWPPADQVREELRQWLRPRVRLAWAERRLDDTVRSLPPTSDSRSRPTASGGSTSSTTTWARPSPVRRRDRRWPSGRTALEQRPPGAPVAPDRQPANGPGSPRGTSRPRSTTCSTSPTSTSRPTSTSSRRSSTRTS